ncbi:MAG: hypothetical protein IT311_00740 [Anaerolineales bacterium]|nr:hypothetical protein [Anaerolineales bacterium]MCZ2122461.1 hypothetical protein [Anaerolineales bacterium]
MRLGTGSITEIYLDGSARLDCPPNLIPTPGQYLLAQASASDAPLPVPLFFYASASKGFCFAPPFPATWTIATQLALRGPLGRGFSIPASARKAALIAFDDTPMRLHGLIDLAFKQAAEVVLVGEADSKGLPEAVEIQPLKALKDAAQWADFIAIDIARENLNRLKEKFENLNQLSAAQEAQVLIRAPMPCGGVAECGVCALQVQSKWQMACKDGPVFIWRDLLK